MFIRGCVDFGRVEGSVEPVERYMKDPDTVEVDEEVCNGALLKVGLEEDSVPIYASEVQVPFGRRYVNQAGLDANKLLGKF